MIINRPTGPLLLIHKNKLNLKAFNLYKVFKPQLIILVNGLHNLMILSN